MKPPEDQSAPVLRKVKMLVEGIPYFVRKRFKAACAYQNQPMRKVLIEMMKKYSRENMPPQPK